MEYNKNQFKKINDKKVLHKKGKQWIAVSVAMLGLLVTGATESSNIHADSVKPTSTTAPHQATSNSAKLVTNSGAVTPSNVKEPSDLASYNARQPDPTAAEKIALAQYNKEFPNLVKQWQAQNNDAQANQNQNKQNTRQNVKSSSSSSSNQPLSSNEQQQGNRDYWIYDPTTGKFANTFANDPVEQGTYNGLTYKYDATRYAVEFTGGQINTTNVSNFLGYFNPSVGAVRYTNNGQLGGIVDSSANSSGPVCLTSVKFDNNLGGFNWDTQSVSSLSHMFSPISGQYDDDPNGSGNLNGKFSDSLKSLVLPRTWDTRNAYNMEYMFADNHNLVNLQLPSSWTIFGSVTQAATSAMSSDEVQSASSAAIHSASLVSYGYNGQLGGIVDSSTSPQLTMDHMFANDKSLTHLDLSNLDTSNTTDMKDMFRNDYDLVSLNLGGNFSTLNTYGNMLNMFGADMPNPDNLEAIHYGYNGMLGGIADSNPSEELTTYSIPVQVLTLSANDKFNPNAKAPKMYLKDANDDCTTGGLVDLGDGFAHPGTWVRQANPAHVNMIDEAITSEASQEISADLNNIGHMAFSYAINSASDIAPNASMTSKSAMMSESTSIISSVKSTTPRAALSSLSTEVQSVNSSAISLARDSALNASVKASSDVSALVSALSETTDQASENSYMQDAIGDASAAESALNRANDTILSTNASASADVAKFTTDEAIINEASQQTLSEASNISHIRMSSAAPSAETSAVMFAKITASSAMRLTSTDAKLFNVTANPQSEDSYMQNAIKEASVAESALNSANDVILSVDASSASQNASIASSDASSLSISASNDYHHASMGIQNDASTASVSASNAQFNAEEQASTDADNAKSSAEIKASLLASQAQSTAESSASQRTVSLSSATNNSFSITSSVVSSDANSLSTSIKANATDISNVSVSVNSASMGIKKDASTASVSASDAQANAEYYANSKISALNGSTNKDYSNASAGIQHDARIASISASNAQSNAEKQASTDADNAKRSAEIEASLLASQAQSTAENSASQKTVSLSSSASTDFTTASTLTHNLSLATNNSFSITSSVVLSDANSLSTSIKANATDINSLSVSANNAMNVANARINANITSIHQLSTDIKQVNTNDTNAKQALSDLKSTVSSTMSTKADKKDLSAFKNAVDTSSKQAKSDLQTLHNAMLTKADKSDLKTVQNDLANLQKNVSNGANSDTVKQLGNKLTGAINKTNHDLSTDRTNTNKAISDLQKDMSQNGNVNTKKMSQDVTVLQQDLGEKADKSTVNKLVSQLQGSINGKAGMSDISSAESTLQNDIDNKADYSTVLNDYNSLTSLLGQSEQPTKHTTMAVSKVAKHISPFYVTAKHKILLHSMPSAVGSTRRVRAVIKPGQIVLAMHSVKTKHAKRFFVIDGSRKGFITANGFFVKRAYYQKNQLRNGKHTVKLLHNVKEFESKGHKVRAVRNIKKGTVVSVKGLKYAGRHDATAFQLKNGKLISANTNDTKLS